MLAVHFFSTPPNDVDETLAILPQGVFSSFLRLHDRPGHSRHPHPFRDHAGPWQSWAAWNAELEESTQSQTRPVWDCHRTAALAPDPPGTTPGRFDGCPSWQSQTGRVWEWCISTLVRPVLVGWRPLLYTRWCRLLVFWCILWYATSFLYVHDITRPCPAPLPRWTLPGGNGLCRWNS